MRWKWPCASAKPRAWEASTNLPYVFLPASLCMRRTASCLRGWQTCAQTCSWSTAQPVWISQPPAYWQLSSEWATESSRAKPQSPAPLWESVVAALSHCGLWHSVIPTTLMLSSEVLRAVLIHYPFVYTKGQFAIMVLVPHLEIAWGLGIS